MTLQNATRSQAPFRPPLSTNAVGRMLRAHNEMWKRRMSKLKHLGFAAALGGAVVVSAAAAATEIKVLASPAVKEAYLELVPAFEHSTENKVTTTWAGTVDILKRIKAGEIFDVVIVAEKALDELTKDGKIVPGSRVDLAKSGIGMAVRSGAPKPDISSADALKRVLLSAKTVGYSTGPSGVYLGGLFERMGVTEDLKAKAKIAKPGESVGEMVASGEAEIGFQQISELLPVKGIDLVGPLPSGTQQITVFSSGIHVGATETAPAKAFVNFFKSPSAADIIKKKGMEPG
jgi:molybdate transport system substrate-binding protein